MQRHLNRDMLGYLAAVFFFLTASFVVLGIWIRFAHWEENYRTDQERFDRIRAIASYLGTKSDTNVRSNATFSDSDFIEGETQAAKNAQLGTLVKSLADTHEIQVLRSEALDTTDPRQTRQLFQLTGTYGNFLSLLETLPEARPRVIIRKFVVSNPAAASVEQASEAAMNFEIEVIAQGKFTK